MKNADIALFASLVTVTYYISTLSLPAISAESSTQPGDISASTHADYHAGASNKSLFIPHAARVARERDQAIPSKDLFPDVARLVPNFTHFRVGNRNVKDILADGEEIWVGTSGGLIQYNARTDRHTLHDNRSGLLANGVFHVGKLNEKLVVGTYGGGMSIFEPRTRSWKTYNVPEGLGDAFVYDVLQMGSGDVWIATWSGVNRVREGALDDAQSWDLFTVENTDGGLPNDWVYALAEGKNGELWLATEGGLARYHGNAWSNWDHHDGLGAPYEQVREQIKFKRDPSQVSEHHARQKVEQGLTDVNVSYNPNYVVSLIVDKDGDVWAGTWGGGLSRFDGENWTTFTVDDGLPSNHVFMLYQDDGGRIWIGTSEGLAMRSEAGFKTYTQSDGLVSDTVFSMSFDDSGTAWVGSYGGIARIGGLE